MFLDALLRVASSQAFGAAGVSNSIDLGTVARRIGTGEAMGFGLSVDVGGTVAPTLFEIISASDADLTTDIVVEASRTLPLAQTVAGALAFLALPPGTPTGRYVGVRLTTAGGTITATADLIPAALWSIPQAYYPKNYAI